MELNQKIVSSIAEALGMKAEDITAKLISEKEEDFKLPEGEFFTTDQLSKRDSSKYSEGKDAGEEMLIKGFKKKYGYEIEGKDADTFFSHHDSQLKNKYSKDNSERVKELELDLAKANEVNGKEIQTLTEQLEGLKSQNTLQGFNNKFYNKIPETTIPKEDVVDIYWLRHKLKKNESGEMYIEKDGTPLKDPKTQSYLDPVDIFSEFAETYKVKTTGRGGDNEQGANPKFSLKSTPQEFQDAWVKKNPDKSTTSSEYDKDYSEYRQAQKKAATAA